MYLDNKNGVIIQNTGVQSQIFCLLLAGSELARLENMYLIWGM